MDQWPSRLRSLHSMHRLRWFALLSVLYLVAFSNPTAWSASIEQSYEQAMGGTVPPPIHQTHLPLVASIQIGDCELNLDICNFTFGYTDLFAPIYSWSPDGSTIAIYGDGENSPQGLYAINTNSKDKQLLFEVDFIDSISYSPDGTMIALSAIQRTDRESLYSLYVYTLATKQLQLLSDLTSKDFNDYMPSWSPDSSKIVFTRHPYNSTVGNTFTIRPDGSELTQLTDLQRSISQAIFSPDGTRIAYTVVGGTDPASIVSISIMEADGSNPMDLTSAIAPTTSHPMWAVDGKSIFFYALAENSQWDIYRINDDGSEPVKLTDDPLKQSYPALSPDGTKILFIGLEEWNGEAFNIYTMNADGSNVVKYQNYHGTSMHPINVRWHPDGRHISYAGYDEDYHLYLLRVKD